MSIFPDQKDFLEKFNISDEEFKKTKLEWNSLKLIFEDFIGNRTDYELVARNTVEKLQAIHKVHSVRFRVKDPEHLIEKIIRKKIENPRKSFTLSNYKTKITDLVGVRAIHLFKDDWFEIDRFIIDTWKLHEIPTANVREGDEINPKYKDLNYKINFHKHGYRSVHYITKTTPTKNLTCFSEVQVRTIFEEGWSEIDHLIKYPYEQNNPILNEYLLLFNRLAGNADEMGTFIKNLAGKISQYENQLEENKALIKNLKNKINKLEIEGDTKKELNSEIDKFTTSNPYVSTYLTNTSNQPINSPSLQAFLGLDSNATIHQSKKCKNCQSPIFTFSSDGLCSSCISKPHLSIFNLKK